MDHDPDKHDDRAVALALAAHHLVEKGGRQSGAGVSGAVRHGREPQRRKTADEEIEAHYARKEARKRCVQAERERARRRPIGDFDPRYA
jgi:hypothetical protein